MGKYGKLVVAASKGDFATFREIAEAELGLRVKSEVENISAQTMSSMQRDFNTSLGVPMNESVKEEE